jgi:ribose transport system substrate-binding protein
MKRHYAGLAAVALTAAAALTACGGSSASSSNTTAVGPTTTAVAAPAASASTTAAGSGATTTAAGAGGSTTTTGSSSGGGIQGSSAFNDAALGQLQSKIQAALSGKSLSSVKIAMVTNGTSSYWNEARAGWNAAMTWLGAHGAKGAFQEPTASTSTQQVSMLETLASQGYSGYGVSAVIPATLTQPIASAVASGMDVLAYDSPLAGTKAAFYIGTPNTDAGCDAGKAMTQALGGSGDVVAISGSLTAANTQQRIGGFKQCMGSGVKVVQTLSDNQDASTAVSSLEAALQANPNIKGIYGVYSYDGGAAGQAVEALHDVGKVKIIADDGEANTVQFVKQDVIQASMLQRPYDQGLMLAYCLAGMKVLGTQALMSLVTPYFAQGESNTLSTGVGVMTQSNLSDFTSFWQKIGISSQ